MATKKKKLPKDFEELLRNGDLQELKNVFNTCEPDARGGYGNQTALFYDNCPHDLAKWLIGQGADLHATDTWGNTALHKRSRSIFGNIQSLLEIGADVNNSSSSVGTPLHAAADSHNAKNTELLIAYGANIGAVNRSGLTPLEQALQTCRNIDIVNTVAIAKLYLKAGVSINARMQEFVTATGTQFEFHRAGFNKEKVDEVSNALDELYSLFSVQPVAKRILHDGKSPITSKATTWQGQHQDLWEQLVPSSGAADTVQGELIRISGRIANELEGNGGINWDDDFKKMADTFWEFVQKGNQFSATDNSETESIIKEIKQRTGNTERLCELAVKWVLSNPTPIHRPAVSYKR